MSEVIDRVVKSGRQMTLTNAADYVFSHISEEDLRDVPAAYAIGMNGGAKEKNAMIIGYIIGIYWQ